MAYMDILLVVDDSQDSEERIDVALRRADGRDAHVLGLMIREQVCMTRAVGSRLPAALIDIANERNPNVRSQRRCVPAGTLEHENHRGLGGQALADISSGRVVRVFPGVWLEDKFFPGF